MLGQINNQSILPEIINVDEFAAQYLKLGRPDAPMGYKPDSNSLTVSPSDAEVSQEYDE